MNTTHAQRIAKCAASIRSNLSQLVRQVDELFELLPTSEADPPNPTPIADRSGRAVRIDRDAFSASCNGKCCELGATKAFFVLERLARKPNVYVQTDQLIDELWMAPRSYSTVRSTVCRLKARLRASGLTDLAEMIDGSNPDHYRLSVRGH